MFQLCLGSMEFSNLETSAYVEDVLGNFTVNVDKRLIKVCKYKIVSQISWKKHGMDIV